ncbi:MAG: hypothetical protein M3P48_07880 [Actinomycetota bacterium]|nr:hypothetical protein [Actinomycetota bacterium]
MSFIAASVVALAFLASLSVPQVASAQDSVERDGIASTTEEVVFAVYEGVPLSNQTKETLIAEGVAPSEIMAIESLPGADSVAALEYTDESDAHEDTSPLYTAPDPGDDSWEVLGTWIMGDGIKTWYRRGRFVNGEGWGHRKISGAHNLNEAAVRTTTKEYGEREIEPSGVRRYFLRVKRFVCSYYCTQVDQRRIKALHEPRYDRGIFNAYCIRQTATDTRRCPDWVKMPSTLSHERWKSSLQG